MEKVNHPQHYQRAGKKECIWQMVEDFGKQITAIFCLTNAYKYIYRAGYKEGSSWTEDIDKARWYVNFVDQHLYSSIQTKRAVELYHQVKKELAGYK